MSKVSDEQIKLDRLVSNLNPRDILDLIGTFIFEMNKNHNIYKASYTSTD